MTAGAHDHAGPGLDADVAALRPILEANDISLLALFGSHATGRHRPDSDLDLGALRSDGRRLEPRQVRSLQDALTRWAGLQADLRDLATPDAIFRFEVASQGRPLLESRPGQWKLFVAQALIDRDDLGPFVALCTAGVGRAARKGAR